MRHVTFPVHFLDVLQENTRAGRDHLLRYRPPDAKQYLVVNVWQCLYPTYDSFRRCSFSSDSLILRGKIVKSQLN